MRTPIKIILFASYCMYITGCANQETSIEQPIIIEEIFTEHPESKNTDTNESQITETEIPKSHFSNAGIEFDYPSDLKIKETLGEDGGRNEFTSENGALIFWYEQGENWRVDMGWNQDTYQKILEDRYPEAIIDEYTKTTINNIEMLNVIFHQSDQTTDEKIVEYIFVGKYAFYDFNFINAEDDFVNELMKTVNLITS